MPRFLIPFRLACILLLTGLAERGPALDGPAGASGECVTAAQEEFRQMMLDPEQRRRLLPAGAMSRLVFRKEASTFSAMLAAMDGPSRLQLAHQLLAIDDVLAARMAAAVALHSGHEQAIPLLELALKRFPDDPEMSLAVAAVGGDPAAQRAAFLHALTRLEALAVPQADSPELFWCCLRGCVPPPDAEVVGAIVAFIQKARPDFLPKEWHTVLDRALSLPDWTSSLPEAPALLAAVIRYQPADWPLRHFERSMAAALQDLIEARQRDAAIHAAALLVVRPGGALVHPQTGATVAIWAQPHSNDLTSVSTQAEAYIWLKLAGCRAPAAFVTALEKALAQHPGDEHLALCVLLARSMGRPLDSGDWNVLIGLDKGASARVITFASILLPPALLPAELCTAAWEEHARQIFAAYPQNSQAVDLGFGLACLDRLTGNGSSDAVDRLLPGLLESLGKAPFPNKQLAALVIRFRTPISSAHEKAWQDLLKKWVVELPTSWDAPIHLAHLVEAASPDPNSAGPWVAGDEEWPLPETLVQRVTAILEASAAGRDYIEPTLQPGREYMGKALLRLSQAVAPHPRWHRLLDGVIARNAGLGLPLGEDRSWESLQEWSSLRASGQLVPDLQLDVEVLPEGETRIRWSFRGLLPSGGPPGKTRPALALPTLAAPLSGQFDALFTVESTDGGSSRVVARIDQLPRTGTIKTVPLPATGRIRGQLVQRAAPFATGTAGPLAYTTNRVLMDTAARSDWPRPLPDGWQILGVPAPLTSGNSWIVASHGAALPAELTFLLLDDSGQVCSASMMIPPPASGQSRNSTYTSAVVRSRNLSPPPVRSAPWQEAAVLTRTPPRYLALAFPAGTGGSGHFSHGPPVPRLTVQERSSSLESGAPSMEILWQWQPSPSGVWNLAYHLDPPQALWWRGSDVILSALEENPSLRRLQLPLERGEQIIEALWQGGVVRFRISPPLPDGKSDAKPFRLITLNTADPNSRPTSESYPGFLTLNPVYLQGKRLPILALVNDRLHKILTPDGGELSVDSVIPAGTPPPVVSEAISPTRLVCHPAPDGRLPILDWTGGSLRLEYVMERPPAPGIPLWSEPLKFHQKGIYRWPSAHPPFEAETPVTLSDAWPLSQGLVLGTSGEVVFLLRAVTTQENLPK